MISKPSLPNKQEGSLSQLLCCFALLLLYNGSTRELISPRNVDLIGPILKFFRLNQIYIDSAAIIMYSNNAQEEKCIIIYSWRARELQEIGWHSFQSRSSNDGLDFSIGLITVRKPT